LIPRWINRNNEGKMPTLRELLSPYVTLASHYDREVTGLQLDSRQLKQGEIFFAYPGTSIDRRDFVLSSVFKRPAAIIKESDAGDKGVYHEALADGYRVPIIPLKGVQAKVGALASRYWGHPSSSLQVIAITGTNGKTSCCQMLCQALHAHNIKSAMIGTTGIGFLGALNKTLLTTPDALQLQGSLAELKQAGACAVSIEASSHALHQDRMSGVEVDLAVFSNLTRDHLDYHSSMEDYGACKERLFARSELQQAVINTDDPFGRYLVGKYRQSKEVIAYGLSAPTLQVPAVYCRSIAYCQQGFYLDVVSPWGCGKVFAPLWGQCNIYNVLAVIASLGALGIDFANIAHHVSKLCLVPGRMEVFSRLGKATCVIDYAHTPDALMQVLSSIRSHCKGRLYCVFGCGGGRDRGKRALMGAVAEKYSDVVLVTSDNPRYEAADDIIAQVCSGMSSRRDCQVEPDRAQAIRLAVGQAKSSDVIVVAGKGHETYQEIKGKCIPYSDANLVESLSYERKTECFIG
jgi:UDP-N-acetylmuramoyl-L-alanyl-D-glutamate--2,6-diaminopimelate ligase